MGARASKRRAPVRAAFSTSRSASSTSSVAIPAAIARSFAAKVGAMSHRPLHAIEDLVKYPFPGQHRSYRDMAARKGFGEEGHVGLDAPVLDCQKAADASLDLIGDQ